MVRGFRYRFYPTPQQRTALARTFGCARYVYNRALELRSAAWRERHESVGYGQTSAALTGWKRELPWLNEVSCVPLQQSLRHLQAAYAAFWRQRTQYPRFRGRHGIQSAEFTRSGFRWHGGQLSLAKIGKLKVRWSRAFSADPSTVTVSRTPAGRYYVSIRVDQPLAQMSPPESGAIGIDLGLTCFAALSDGSKIPAPRPLRRKLAQLRRAQKALARKRKGSQRREKARLRVARIHERIADIRHDFLHKLSTGLVRENQAIAVEDLNVRGMLANRSLARGIADSGWGELLRQLEYKCAWHGRAFVRIARFHPSSKLCSACGFRCAAMPLAVREWSCPGCGLTHDRDVNAARNILAAGQAVIARGDSVRPKRELSRRRSRQRSGNRPVHCV